MTKKEQIVIVTDQFDPHTDMVIVELRKRGYQPVRLHTADFPTSASVTLDFDQQHWGGELTLFKGPVYIDDIKSIWWRRPEPYVISADLSKGEREFARGETEHTFAGVWRIIDCYWMSFPTHIRQASNKIEQLQRAAQLGFRVPRTLITNDPSRVQEFYDRCNGEIVYKSLAMPRITANDQIFQEESEENNVKVVYTTRITQDQLSLLEAVRTAPCQFQELIPKCLELRVTIIGDDMFVCEIHSQEDERTSLDWRHYEVSIPYKKGSLPPEIAEKCFALMKSYNLNYSAMDLILTPEGEYVFLENNPSGQCFFIQRHIPEFKMVEAVASYLIRGKA
jgi:glutathione synthase/RimK-type ligase-like ATP-grasp enzyme